ncbi:MAG: hypothetical protein HUU54_08390 [Ignavibacteriaceae bacterium]|nr:hypothetical protein [Ignavibacteriaceae bacterium]
MNNKTNVSDFSNRYLIWLTAVTLLLVLFLAGGAGLIGMHDEVFPVQSTAYLIIKYLSKDVRIFPEAHLAVDLLKQILVTSSVIVFFLSPFLLIAGFVLKKKETESESRYRINPSGLLITTGLLLISINLMSLFFSPYDIAKKDLKSAQDGTEYYKLKYAAGVAIQQIVTYHYTSAHINRYESLKIRDEVTGSLRFIKPDDFPFRSGFPEYRFIISPAGTDEYDLCLISQDKGRDKSFINQDGQVGYQQVQYRFNPGNYGGAFFVTAGSNPAENLIGY